MGPETTLTVDIMRRGQRNDRSRDTSHIVHATKKPSQISLIVSHPTDFSTRDKNQRYWTSQFPELLRDDVQQSLLGALRVAKGTRPNAGPDCLDMPCRTQRVGFGDAIAPAGQGDADTGTLRYGAPGLVGTDTSLTSMDSSAQLSLF